MKIFTKLFIILLLFISANYAQVGVGKLSGKIIDADTKEALIGANVIILGTQLGAASNIEGDYFILNITPGTYSVKVSYVGYAPRTIENVRIVAGITYELNVELSTDFSLAEIVVIDRKFFESKSTNTVKVIDSDQISRLPVRGVSQLASIQSGVVTQEGSGGAEGNATINIRGGRGSEVLYIIDGVPQNNLYTRTSATQVSNVAIEQISFQVGGYEAKYGQAQSGIINVTTKSGNPVYRLSADVLSSTFTDDYGYNLYSATVSGPIIPGVENHTIFLSAERGFFQDADPSAIDLEYYFLENGKYVKHSYNNLPNDPANVWRLSGRTSHHLGAFSVNLGAIYNDRTSKVYDNRMAKNSSDFFDQAFEKNISLSTRISQTVSNSTFWNLNLGYRDYNFNRYNPFLKDNLALYGDSTYWAQNFGVNLLADGQRTQSVDANGVFRPFGYSTGLYQKRDNETFSGDIDFTSQIANHLFEIGGGISYNIVRGYGVFSQPLPGMSDTLSSTQKYYNLSPFVYGYSLDGQSKVGTNYTDPRDVNDPLFRADKLQAAHNPIIAYAYIQDRYELEDLVLNLGLRMDYFDIKSFEFVNPEVPYGGGIDPSRFDNADFKVRDPQIEFSPRIGIGFPITESTVFHAQYGRFIQVPELNDLYLGPFDYDDYITFGPQDVGNGSIESEETTQYEVGFRKILSDIAAINITLFYKNIKGLVNTENSKYRSTAGGEIRNAIIRTNADFGTSKGLALSFDIAHLNYFSLSAQYTLSKAEGTGSSTSSSQTSVFRNTDKLPPKVIAPLSFDQTHTGVVNVDFYVPKGELGILELLDANFLFSYNSGRPYTPVDKYNIIGDNGIIGSTTSYINSTYTPGTFRIDMKVEKGFLFDKLQVTPYVWIENLLDADNVVNVWRSTGDPLTTGWLNTTEGKAATHTEGYALDYMSLERNPANFGIPRTIKLGLKVNFQ